MERKSFQKYLEKRLNKDEIAEIEQLGKLEKKALESLQNNIARAINNYMEKNKIGFTELVRRLNVSPTQVAKIQKGEANLTYQALQRFVLLSIKSLIQYLELTENHDKNYNNNDISELQ